METFNHKETSSATSIKFLCSYDGKILPRPSDGKLRYVGGYTRVLSLPRSVSLSELMAKLSELCGQAVKVRCQLPSTELDDVLVSIKSDQDLGNLIEVYDLASSISSRELKIRAFLYPIKSSARSFAASSSSSAASSTDVSTSSPRKMILRSGSSVATRPAIRQVSTPAYNKYGAVRRGYYPCNVQANPTPACFVPSHLHRWHYS